MLANTEGDWRQGNALDNSTSLASVFLSASGMEAAGPVNCTSATLGEFLSVSQSLLWVRSSVESIRGLGYRATLFRL